MKRKLVQAGNSLAVTLPADLVAEFGLEKGMAVEMSVHPRTGAITVLPGVRRFEEGKVTRRFEKLLEETAEVYDEAFRELAK